MGSHTHPATPTHHHQPPASSVQHLSTLQPGCRNNPDGRRARSSRLLPHPSGRRCTSLNSRPPGAPPKKKIARQVVRRHVNSRRRLHQWILGWINMIGHVTQHGRQAHLALLKIHQIRWSIAIGRDIFNSGGEPILHSSTRRGKRYPITLRKKKQ